MQCSLENSTAGKAAAPTTFTLCVTRPDRGAQLASATSITELCVEGGDGFAQAVEQALDERADSAGSVWLDVSSPSAADIICLAQIFDMDSTTTSDLLSGAGSGNNAAASQQNGPWPACQVTSRALYLCWQETIATEAGLGQYLVKGTVPGQIDTALEGHGHGSWWAADLVPVPQWLMPSASKAVSGYHMSAVVKMMVDGSVGASDAEVEQMRQQYVQQLLGLLDRPRRRDTSGLLSAIRRWGTRYERWAGLLGRSGQTKRQPGRSSDFVGDILGVTQALVGRGTVQMWVQGPIVLTFHREPSQAISDIQRELAEIARPVSPDSILHGLIEHWAHATSECLPVLERLADKLDHDLTRPAEGALVEASQWTPVIVRCRKVALALLRRCQENEYVLAQLCRHMRDRQSGSSKKAQFRAKRPPKILRSASNTQSMTAASGRRIGMRAIAQFSEERRAETLAMQCLRARDSWALYKKAEVRLSRLHRILLDRQCLRVLAVAHKIHQRFRYLVMYEVIYLPMELWNNLDNMNGIATPGELQGGHDNVDDFYWALIGLLLWAGAAGLLYSVYSRFFAPTLNSQRVKNIRDMQSRRQKYQKRLQEMYEQSGLAW